MAAKNGVGSVCQRLGHRPVRLVVFTFDDAVASFPVRRRGGVVTQQQSILAYSDEKIVRG